MKYLLLLSVQFFATSAFSQQAAVSAGGEINSTNGNISYSIGQTFYEFNIVDSLTFNHGVQQPFKSANPQTIFVKKLVLEVYPNPATQLICINLNSYESNKLSYSIINPLGIIIEGNSLRNDVSMISIDYLPPSTYFLLIHDDFNQIASFKIIKL